MLQYQKILNKVVLLLGAVALSLGVCAQASVSVTDIYEVGQGSVAMTSQGQTINNQYTYSPYGQSHNVNKPQTVSANTDNSSYSNLLDQTRDALNIQHNQYGYTGQAQDPSTSLMMLGGFRNYAPGIGQFIQPDTYNSFSAHSINNKYAYVDSNPMLGTDPTGHFNVGGVLSALGLNPFNTKQFFDGIAYSAAGALFLGGIGMAARMGMEAFSVDFGSVVTKDAAADKAGSEGLSEMNTPRANTPKIANFTTDPKSVGPGQDISRVPNIMVDGNKLADVDWGGGTPDAKEFESRFGINFPEKKPAWYQAIEKMGFDPMIENIHDSDLAGAFGNGSDTRKFPQVLLGMDPIEFFDKTGNVMSFHRMSEEFPESLEIDTKAETIRYKARLKFQVVTTLADAIGPESIYDWERLISYRKEDQKLATHTLTGNVID